MGQLAGPHPVLISLHFCHIFSACSYMFVYFVTGLTTKTVKKVSPQCSNMEVPEKLLQPSFFYTSVFMNKNAERY